MDQHNLIGVAPVATTDRIKSIDTIRGFALLGILLMNIPGFAMNQNFWYPLLSGARSGYDYLTFSWISIFFDGTMRGLFSMLFGAGMILFMTNKKELSGQASVAEYYYRRLLWLVFFGIINAYVILWFGDILFYYGLFGMLLFPFRKLAAKWLLVIGIACVSFAIIRSEWGWSESREKRETYIEAMAAKKEHKKLTDEQQAAVTYWAQLAKPQKPDTAETNLNIRSMREKSYFSVFKYLLPKNATYEVTITYYDAWDMLAMMFIGMALLTWGFFSNKLRTSTYAMWLLIGYGVGIPFGYFLFDSDMTYFGHNQDYVTHWKSAPWIFGEFRRIFISVGHASLLMLLFRSKLVPWLMKALSAVGQMAFTNYLMQSIICTFFFYGYGFGNFDKLHYHQIYYVVGIVWVFQMIFSVIWLRYFRFGPFEWVWRSLTYWKKQPMKL